MANEIKAIALDVDGVLTDGGFWWGPNGEEFKQFNFADVMGISLGRKAGLLFALISGEASPLVDRFAEKMGIVDIHKGCKDKAAALRAFAQKNNLELQSVCFMGDNVNDLSAMQLAGLAPPRPVPSPRSASASTTSRGEREDTAPCANSSICSWVKKGQIKFLSRHRFRIQRAVLRKWI